nr:sugar nucleotide-binding protein [Desulfobulbaceae bacterium]
MKIAVIGANGQLGIDVCQAFKNNNDEVIKLNHDIFDITDSKAVTEKLHTIHPDLVINTAAMHNVEACEENPAQAFAVNGIGARNLAIASKTMGFTLFHISTDYVFDGNKNSPYLESDSPR